VLKHLQLFLGITLYMLETKIYLTYSCTATSLKSVFHQRYAIFCYKTKQQLRK